jgi:hypothetical protein
MHLAVVKVFGSFSLFPSPGVHAWEPEPQQTLLSSILPALAGGVLLSERQSVPKGTKAEKRKEIGSFASPGVKRLG